MDDGSTDDTRELVSGVSDPRLRLLADTNHGPAHARNQGCRAARATGYVAFLDADDSWDGEKLLEQTRFLEANPDARRGGVLHALRLVVGQGHRRDRPDPPAGGPSPSGRGGAVPVPHVEPDRPAISARAQRALRRVLSVCRLGGSRFPGPTRVRGSAAVRPSRPGVLPHPPGSAMARERLRINAEARFVRQRIARRAAGGDLTWERVPGDAPADVEGAMAGPGGGLLPLGRALARRGTKAAGLRLRRVWR